MSFGASVNVSKILIKNSSSLPYRVVPYRVVPYRVVPLFQSIDRKISKTRDLYLDPNGQLLSTVIVVNTTFQSTIIVAI